jgi:alpha-D-xyloside xylohydrolase
LTGEVRQGGRWYFDEQDFFEIPLWIREGAVVPLGAVNDKPEYDHRDDVRLVFGSTEQAGSQSVTIQGLGPQATAHRFEIEGSKNRLTVKSTDGEAHFEVHLPWASSASDVTGGQVVQLSPNDAPEHAPGLSKGVLVRATSNSVSFTWSS